MWEIIDDVVGEVIDGLDYDDALMESDRRVMVHGQYYPIKHYGKHYPIKCKIIIDKETKKITISVKGYKQ